MSHHPVTGLFGKIPAHPEFVRVHTGDPAAQALVLWLEEGSEARSRAGAGAECVRFAFSPPGVPTVLVGAVADSSDQVGRRFPLAVFSSADARELAAAFPAVPRSASAFLDAAASLLGEAGRLRPQELPARLEALPSSEDGAVSRDLAALGAAAASAPAREILGTLLGDPAAGQQWYALHCFRTACQPLRGREPSGAGVVLDCPARDDVDRFMWLELAHRLLGWARPPSFFWTGGAAGRLLVALGAPPPALLAAAWDPSRRDAKIWPLTTPKPEAIAAARRALGPSVRGLFEGRGGSIMDLLSTLEP